MHSSGGVTHSAAPQMASPATISALPTIKKPESSSGMTIKLVHPDEDISLVCIGRAFETVSFPHSGLQVSSTVVC